MASDSQKSLIRDQMRVFGILTVMFVVIIAVGTAGYVILEGWAISDAAYMTIITLSTVGYGEVRPVGPAGRVFTIVLIIIGVGFFFYSATLIMQFLLEGTMRKALWRRRLEKRISRISDHFIVCGFGRIGRVLCLDLADGPHPVVAIDRVERPTEHLAKSGILYLTGEATEEDNLKAAGIERARALIAALGTDTDNVFVVLTARQLNPGLFVMARANDRSSVNKLAAAGANKVISPYEIAGRRMAEGILRPTVTDFLELTMSNKSQDIQMEEIPVSPDSRLVGVALADSNIRRDLNLIIIAIKKSDGSMQFNPSHEAVIYPHDTVIAVGQVENLAELEVILNPR